jgi:hypothetical protein
VSRFSDFGLRNFRTTGTIGTFGTVFVIRLERLEQLERSVAVEPLDKLRASYSKTSGRRAKTVDHRRKNSKNPTSTKNLRRERSGKSAWHVDAVACLSGGNKSLRLGARSPLPRTIEYNCDDHCLYGEKPMGGYLSHRIASPDPDAPLRHPCALGARFYAPVDL